MFTVIIAEKEILDLFSDSDIFLHPLMSGKKVAFCEWNKEGNTLEEMLPGIYDAIEFQTEWRAVIVYSDGMNSINPFDFVGYSEPHGSEGSFAPDDWDHIAERRHARFDAYKKASLNPLTKLTNALCSVPSFTSAISDRDTFTRILSGELPLYEYMLALQYKTVDLTNIANRFQRFDSRFFENYTSVENAEALIECVRRGDVKGTLSLVSPDKIVDFIKLVGDNDPIHSDPNFIDLTVENTYIAELYDTCLKDNLIKDVFPREIICVAPRTLSMNDYRYSTSWRPGTDARHYSDFPRWNLYPESTKYFVMDMAEEDNRQYPFDRVRMLCFILVLANNPLPKGTIASGQLYRADIDFNTETLEQLCAAYIAKLRVTGMHLKDVSDDLEQEASKTIADQVARKAFESDAKIDVSGAYGDKKELYAKYDRIGMSFDCPGNERAYWGMQYDEIEKKFVRYLREPRRALKSAVNDQFRRSNRIEDDRVSLLSENQLEDIRFKLYEEEEKMVSTDTVRIYDTAGFKKELDEADRTLMRAISKRMTKKKTVIVALIAIAAYLFGFLPMLFSSSNKLSSFLFSLVFIGIALGVYTLVGFVFLIVKRHKLRNVFKHFNYVMSGICARIEEGMARFSEYLSHACNVMREFSVLDRGDSPIEVKQRIVRYHKQNINDRIKAANELFSKYINFGKIDISDAKPYEYDFTVLKEYRYEMPGTTSKKTIEFMQKGNHVTVPIEYVESVSAEREELYD